jgi:hypothetical protein
MPARDFYHDVVRQALIKDGWTITHDPLKLSWGGKDMFVDLGAEQLLAAEKAERQIAVEIKSFLGASEMADLEQALGQYLVYAAVMRMREPTRTLYLAVPHDIWLSIFDEPLGRLLLQTYPVNILSFDSTTQEFNHTAIVR